MKSHPWNLVFAYLPIVAAGAIIPFLIFQETTSIIFYSRIGVLVACVLAAVANCSYWLYRLRKDAIDEIERHNAELDHADEQRKDTNIKVCYRHGFTLVELLVVIFLIAILAAIGIMFFPNAASAQREARGAIAVQSWLNIAKSKARRDNAPRGVRFYLFTENVNGVALPFMVKDAAYIEQPDDFSDGTVDVTGTLGTPFFAWPPPTWDKNTTYPPLSNVLFNGQWYYNIVNSFDQRPDQTPGVWKLNFSVVNFTADILNGNTLTSNPLAFNPPSNSADTGVKLWSVQPGDYIEIRGGLMHRIVAILPGNRVAVTPPIHYLVNPTPTYKVMRSPRVSGDEQLKMPDGVFLDTQTNATFKNPLPLPNALTDGTGFFDILFAPNGSVISKGVSEPNLHLWVRAPNSETPADPFRGSPSIISVFVRTGFSGSYDVDPSSGNPYSFVR